MLIGYARVSSEDQNTELQLSALKSAGCERVFQDRLTGTRRNRPELLKALACLKEGDSLVVWKLDRLARSMLHLLEIATDFRERNVELRSLTEAIDTSSPAGEFFFQVLCAFAEFERDMIAERLRASIAARKAAGTYRLSQICLPRHTAEQRALAETMLLTNATWEETAAAVGMSKPGVQRLFPGGKAALGIRDRKGKKVKLRNLGRAKAARRGGASWAALASLLGVSETRAKFYLRGVKPTIPKTRTPPVSILTERILKDVSALLLDGASWADAASHAGVHPDYLKTFFPGGKAALLRKKP